MPEFSLIERYCQAIGERHASTVIGVGDDAAVIEAPAGMSIAVSVDTMVAGVHFIEDTAPALIAHKLAAVNLSDMAAMGAQPKWATLALTLPSVDDDWINEFSIALHNISSAYGVQLIGGDTTQGPLCLSMQIMGLLNNGEALTRNGALIGDDCYVSGSLGDAALALAAMQGRVELSRSDLQICRLALEKPIPQVALGNKLLNVATSAIDLSDGLVADLGHVAKQSKVSISIDIDKLPLSIEYQSWLNSHGHIDLALNGGDDYQLAFTAQTKQREAIEQFSVELGITLTKIGKVIGALDEPVSFLLDNAPYKIAHPAGFEHFSAQ